ncbi:MAG: hypothetical protein K5845_20930, partial [Filomicrobium sp.]|nr:hypothetical protein [Filomicrobium sp.]
MKIPPLVRLLGLVVGLAAWGGVAFADCSSPAGTAGQMVYAGNHNTFAFCNGTNWVSMAGWNNSSGGGASLLNELTDVVTAGATTGSILSYNGSAWVVSSTSAVPSVLNDLTDVNTAGAVAGNVIRYNGSTWVVSDATSVAALASLTDVTLTNLAGRDYLRYDAGTSKWVNISESTVMSTTTMRPGFPDSITCTSSGSTYAMVLGESPYTDGKYYYYRPNAPAYYIGFNADGTYSAHGNMGSSDCVTGSKSVATLYAEGKAFNFIGNADAGSTALGDRITSGTLGMVANSATSYISLSTNGTDWGYLSSGVSYLPTITANKVSSTNISATYVHLNSATTPLACDSGFTGAMRYTSGTMQVCDGNNWGNIGIGVPGGTIAAFEAVSCPAGWSEYTPARGRFLRGIDTLAAGIDPSGTRAPGNIQEDTL